ncbi:S8 family serine peptidase (plasmid) [Alteromonas marina]|uniref:S8 family peptidase n=1 Tax=Alteromonas sp. KUL150 TaxID=2480805 RepID=UPI0012E5DEA2|nr:S8 family serine peptidase [Alteromonas sp. KUL150]GFD86893.1 hypothetical protein KUL150_29520 [Alteromonas sp. KUL150]
MKKHLSKANTVALTASIVASFSINYAAADTADDIEARKIWSPENVAPVRIIDPDTQITGNRTFKIEHYDHELVEGTPYKYVVRFKDKPVPLYQGSVPGLEATNPHMKLMKMNNRFLSDSAVQKIVKDAGHIESYVRYLKGKQQSMMDSIYNVAPANQVIASLQFAMNGVVLKVTPEEAEKIARLDGVLAVERDVTVEIETDVGPSLIGAPAVWSGSASNGLSEMGEGIVIGIIDSGINTDHPSFAAVGDDGYAHTNPLGKGNYVGDCANGFPELCNDKLIGVRSYNLITDNYSDSSVFPPGLPANGEDYSGHGSHVASTAGGNVLFDVPLQATSKVEESDGIPLGLSLDRLSGVAPHANIISYQVCSPGGTGDTYGGCSLVASVLAIEDAIKDGVDVLNYSISSPPGNPWNNAVENAFLAARNSGMFVATSAGNSGRQGTNKSAPWYTSVAATEHGRQFTLGNTLGQFSGGAFDLSPMAGQGIGDMTTGSIVYAGDFTIPNETNEIAAKCLVPFPAGTFENNIVVCDRGDIGMVTKSRNVEAGGASGIIVVNTAETADTLIANEFSIPGIHLRQSDGDSLKQWLTSGSQHQGTIFAPIAGEQFNPDRVDAIADFSSRGPNQEIDTLSPTLAAPGVSIYAANADQQFGKDGTGPNASDFRLLSGTSMASPHVTGAAALLKGLHPSWTPDNIRSALSMTAERTVTLEDGSTPADALVMGSGRIRVDLAAKAGLVMDELDVNYAMANPADGGDEKTLNLPSLTDSNCLISCSWTRTVTATQDGSWVVNTQTESNDITVVASPQTFELDEGESQTINFELRSRTLVGKDWTFGQVVLSSTSSPELHMPILVSQSSISVPDVVNINAKRNTDSQVFGDFFIGNPQDLTINTSMARPQSFNIPVPIDSDNESVFDNLEDGTLVIPISTFDVTTRVVFEVTETTASEYSLYLIHDRNQNGLPEAFELIQSFDSEFGGGALDLVRPDKGDYWIVLQNKNNFIEGATNDFGLEFTYVESFNDDVVSVANTLSEDGITSNLRFVWSIEDDQNPSKYYGVVTFGVEGTAGNEFAAVPINLTKLEDDISITTEQFDRINKGQKVDYKVKVATNLGPNDRRYNVVIDLPKGVLPDMRSLPDNATFSISENTLSWDIVQLSTIKNAPSYRFTTNENDNMCQTPLSAGLNGGYIPLSELGVPPLLTSEASDGIVQLLDISPSFLGRTETPEGIPYVLSIFENGLISIDEFSRSVVFNTSGLSNNPRAMPDQFILNGLIAPFWRDLVIDRENGGNMYFGTTSNFQLIVVEWDKMRFKSEAAGIERSNDTISFQALFNQVPAEDEPNIIFAYRDVEHDLGNQAPVVIGYENFAGTEGEMFTYSNGESVIGDITKDVVADRFICMYLEQPGEEKELPFTLTVTGFFEGNSLTFEASSEVIDDDFTLIEPVIPNNAVEIEAAPEVSINGKPIFFSSFTTEITLTGDASDSNGDELEYLWTQTAGPDIVIDDNTNPILTVNASNASFGSRIELQLEASDGNGNTSTAKALVVVMPSFTQRPSF